MGIFKYENDLLKHFIRTQAWLPTCKRRLAAVRSNPKRKGDLRRLRYFTFCAVGAIDVLMLDVARVIRQSNDGEFDTVVFFDRGDIEVLETQKRIPGAHGYPGDFVDLVLLPDADEEVVVDGLEHLAAPASDLDEAVTRERQRRLAQRQIFIREFPFDVANLDLEGFFFRAGDPFPGRLVNALRTILRWQRRPIERPKRAPEHLDGFSLMFTTQIGPPNLGQDYLQMLRDALNHNLARDGTLRELLIQRAGIADCEQLQRDYFEIFFKVAVPKLIASLLLEEDWYVDAERGVSVYEIERESQDGPYKMLHLVLDVRRQNPTRERRAPGAAFPVEVTDAYAQVARSIFAVPEVVVTDAILDQTELQASLAKIRARRRKYYPDEEENAAPS